MWSARDRTVIAKTKQYLEESKSLKEEIEQLEPLLGPDDTNVDFRRILEETKGRTRLRDMGQAPKEADCTVAAKFVRFIK